MVSTRPGRTSWHSTVPTHGGFTPTGAAGGLTTPPPPRHPMSTHRVQRRRTGGGVRQAQRLDAMAAGAPMRRWRSSRDSHTKVHNRPARSGRGKVRAFCAPRTANVWHRGEDRGEGLRLASMTVHLRKELWCIGGVPGKQGLMWNTTG
jgi:hypothetical protein